MGCWIDSSFTAVILDMTVSVVELVLQPSMSMGEGPVVETTSVRDGDMFPNLSLGIHSPGSTVSGPIHEDAQFGEASPQLVCAASAEFQWFNPGGLEGTEVDYKQQEFFRGCTR